MHTRSSQEPLSGECANHQRIFLPMLGKHTRNLNLIIIEIEKARKKRTERGRKTKILTRNHSDHLSYLSFRSRHYTQAL